ncbi:MULTISPECIES: hypothetical protein [Nocardia]|uniref:hypothetical protein n=1 Tax=Nocardia TaxID=1817 RepID=UPI000D68817A|nr:MULTISPECIES: hypothetical protein [Nocardia]
MNWPVIFPIAAHLILGIGAWIASHHVRDEWRIPLRALGVGLLILLDLQLVGAGLAFVTTCEFGACR